MLATGLYMTAWPIAIMPSASFSGRLAGRMSRRRDCARSARWRWRWGSLRAAFDAGALGRFADPASLMTLAGLGFGIFQPANNRLLLLSAPKARSGAAGGVQATTRLVGQTFGATAMTALFQLAPGDAAPRLGLVVAAGFALSPPPSARSTRAPPISERRPARRPIFTLRSISASGIAPSAINISTQNTST